MGAVKPGSGDVAQHAGETTATPEVRRRRLHLDWRTRTALRLAASLCMDGGRKRSGTSEDPCRNHGEDRFPHNHLPKMLRHPLN
jgi:hypothetical protein